MNDLKGKRLLILGGQLKMCDIVKRARELNVHTVVTDWYQNSPAKEMADQAFDVSISDKSAVMDLIKNERIDGVFTGFIDSYLPHYYEICKTINFPCYLNLESLRCSIDKQYFKSICSKLGIQTIPDVDIRAAREIHYPIVVKPVDNSGSKGITICCNESMIYPAIERARRFSKSKRYLIERFLDCDYVAAYYTVNNGKAHLSLLMDKDTNRVGRGKIPYPVAYVSPSRYRDLYVSKADPLVRKLVNYLNMKDGTFIISFFVDNDQFYAVEFGARLTATREYVITGEDILGMHINHALTGVFEGDTSIHSENDNSIYCMLLHFISEGTIGRIEGTEAVRSMNGLLDVLQYRDVGATVRADGSYGQLFYRVYLQAKDSVEMVNLVERVQSELSVTSTDKKPMIFTGFDARSFFRN